MYWSAIALAWLEQTIAERIAQFRSKIFLVKSDTVICDQVLTSEKEHNMATAKKAPVKKPVAKKPAAKKK